jgi:3D (Asp-Asp-Asp) domain-containing protein
MVDMKARSRLQKRSRKQKVILISTAILGLLIGYILAVNISSKQKVQEVRSIPNSASVTIVEQVHASEEIVIEEVLIAKVTAYSCGGLKTEAEIKMNCPSLLSGKPRTADGSVPVAYKTVACDRANLGKYFDIESVGRVKCTDTGGSINGAGRFDLYVTDVAEARKWGVKQLSYTLASE